MIVKFMADKLIITFDEYNKIVEKLAIEIHKEYKPTVLVGIMRGAAPILDILSRILKLPIAYIVIQSYSGEGMEDKQGQLMFAREISSLAENKDYVVATYQEVSSGPKSKTRTTATESFDITSVDQEARPLNLEFPDVISIISVTHKDGNVDTDITNQFILDGGQRDNFYDNGSAHVKGGYKIPTGANVVVEVEYEYFAHGAGGRYFACSSYANEEYENIPNHTTKIN